MSKLLVDLIECCIIDEITSPYGKNFEFYDGYYEKIISMLKYAKGEDILESKKILLNIIHFYTVKCTSEEAETMAEELEAHRKEKFIYDFNLKHTSKNNTSYIYLTFNNFNNLNIEFYSKILEIISKIQVNVEKAPRKNLLPLYVQIFINDEINSKNNRFYIKNIYKINPTEPNYFYKPFPKCEGYYSGNFNWQPMGVSIHDFDPLDESFLYPIPFQGDIKWEDKNKWIRMALDVQKYLLSSGENGIDNSGISPSVSRLDGNILTKGEYHDEKYNICWPSAYVGYYIKEMGVLPSEKFYRYVIKKFEEISVY